MTDSLPDERPQRRREYSGPASTMGLAALVIVFAGLAIWFLEFREPLGANTGSEFGIVELPAPLNATGKPPVATSGRAAPNFRLFTLDGAAADLTDFRGKFVLLNFWATWCGPCRGETPDLAALFARAGGDSFTILGINQQESPADVRSFATEFGVTYPVLLDRSGEVSRGYRVDRGLPVSFLVGPDGTVLAKFTGRVSAADLARIELDYLR